MKRIGLLRELFKRGGTWTLQFNTQLERESITFSHMRGNVDKVLRETRSTITWPVKGKTSCKKCVRKEPKLDQLYCYVQSTVTTAHGSNYNRNYNYPLGLHQISNGNSDIAWIGMTYMSGVTCSNASKTSSRERYLP